jgi:hypothetical protein
LITELSISDVSLKNISNEMALEIEEKMKIIPKREEIIKSNFLEIKCLTI